MQNIIIEAIKESIKAKAAEIVQDKAEQIVGEGVEIIKRNIVNPNAKPKSEREVPEAKKPIPDQTNNKKRKLQEDEQEVPEETTKTTKMSENMELQTQGDVPPTQSLSMGGSGQVGVGVRGKLTGNTELNKKYSTYYQEIHELHSRKVKNWDLWYGMAPNHNTGNANDSTLASGNVYVRNGLVANCNTGVLMTPIDNAFPGAGQSGGTMVSPRPLASATPDDIMFRSNSWSDGIVAAPLNFCVDDLIDSKLNTDDGLRGLFTNYQKFRLLDFSIELTFKTYDTSAQSIGRAKKIVTTVPNPWQQVQDAQQTVTFNSTETVERTCGEQIRNIDYWVYRDFYNDYSRANTANIPLEWTTTGAPPAPPTTIDRRVRGIRNLDVYLTLVEDEHVFKFRREIRERASYFLTLAQINALRGQPLQYLVNLLEGITPTTQEITPLQEGFNLLIAPTQCPLAYSAQQWAPVGATQNTYYMVVPAAMTKVYCKIHATWKAFDFNYSNLQIQRHLSDWEVTQHRANLEEWQRHIEQQKKNRKINLKHYYKITN